jgi:hypothetical protein
MRKYVSACLITITICTNLFGDNWIEVSHRDGESLHFNKVSFHEISPNLIAGKTGSTYSNGSVIERDTRVNCIDNTISYGLTVSRYPNGTEKTMDLSKNGWIFFTAIDKAEKKLIKKLCGYKNK